MVKFSTIPEKQVKKKPPKKYNLNLPSTAGPVFNIETGKTRKIIPISAKAYDIPIFAYPSTMAKSSAYRSAIIIDIHRKLKKVKENIKNCDINALNDLCKVSNIVDIHLKYIYADPSFDILNRDIMKIKQEFIDGCKLSTKITKK